jgi:hypothetical protein
MPLPQLATGSNYVAAGSDLTAGRVPAEMGRELLKTDDEDGLLVAVGLNRSRGRRLE